MGKVAGPVRVKKSVLVEDLVKSLGLPPGSLSLDTLKASEIKGDLSYQRDPRKRLGTLIRIADNFDPLRLGIIHVVQRPDGFFYAIDGLGRCYVITELLKDKNSSVLCAIHNHIKTEKEEANWFVKLNPPEQKKANPKDIFRAAVHAGDKHALRLVDQAERGGLIINGAGARSISTQSAEFLDKLGLLVIVGQIKNEAWPKSKAGNPTLNALGAVLFSSDTLDPKRLIEVLSVIKPKILEADTVEEYGKWEHARVGANKLALMILHKYNYRLNPKNKIHPCWDALNAIAKPGTDMYDRWRPIKSGVFDD